MLKYVLTVAVFFTCSVSFSNSQIKVSDTQTCEGFPLVTNFKSKIKGKCLGLALDTADVPWKKPRNAVFLDEKTVLVTDMGGWGSRKSGAVWKIDLENKKRTKLYSGGDWTHGLAIDSKGRVLFSDTDKIMRFDTKWQVSTLIKRLPSKGSHPVSHFILDSEDNIIVNVGAPTNDCSETISGTVCDERDVEGEIRLYKYKSRSDRYDRSFLRIARGLRNSMALYLNENEGVLYQAENNLDKPGIPEEMNKIPMERWGSMDFGWPFCYGKGETYDMPQDKEKKKKKISHKTFDNFCQTRADGALFLIPPHSSPLGMMVYKGEAHPEFQNQLLMTWHGHRRDVELAMVMYRLDKKGHPIYAGDGLSDYTPVLAGKADGPKEKLRPVGMTVDDEGLLWIVEDMSKALLVFGNKEEDIVDEGGDKDQHVEKVKSFMTSLDSRDLKDFEKLYSTFYKAQSCTRCHGSKEMPENSNKALETYLTRGWLNLDGPAREMLMFKRTSKDAVKPMPPSGGSFEANNPKIYQSLLEWVEYVQR